MMSITSTALDDKRAPMIPIGRILPEASTQARRHDHAEDVLYRIEQQDDDGKVAQNCPRLSVGLGSHLD